MFNIVITLKNYFTTYLAVVEEILSRQKFGDICDLYRDPRDSTLENVCVNDMFAGCFQDVYVPF